MKKLKAAALAVAASVGAFIGSQGDTISDSLSSKERFIVIGQQRGMIQAFGEGVQVKKQLEYDNGYVIKATKEKAEELKAKGLKVYQDRQYSIEMGGKPCECEPCPKPTPDPVPVPDQFSDDVPWGTQRIKTLEAWKHSKGDNIIVCVADTGVDVQHEDLIDAIAGGRSFVDGNASYQDDEGHGTHVASTIAARINQKGIVGVSQAKIYAVKVLNSAGSGWGSDIADGIRHCVQAGASVINLSLGSPAAYGPDPYIRDAVLEAAQAGVIVVSAAGNDSGPVGYPAAIECPNCYAIAASDSNNRIASFSSRGPEIDFIAPGVNIRGARLGGGYVNLNGTSMAAPHAAAVFALALERGRTKIKATPIGLPPEHQGQGLIDALNSVK
jgi:subtilisin family serine protease